MTAQRHGVVNPVAGNQVEAEACRTRQRRVDTAGDGSPKENTEEHIEEHVEQHIEENIEENIEEHIENRLTAAALPPASLIAVRAIARKLT